MTLHITYPASDHAYFSLAPPSPHPLRKNTGWLYTVHATTHFMAGFSYTSFKTYAIVGNMLMIQTSTRKGEHLHVQRAKTSQPSMTAGECKRGRKNFSLIPRPPNLRPQPSSSTEMHHSKTNLQEALHLATISWWLLLSVSAQQSSECL